MSKAVFLLAGRRIPSADVTMVSDAAVEDLRKLPSPIPRNVSALSCALEVEEANRSKSILPSFAVTTGDAE